MRWLNRDVDSGACAQPPDSLTHWLHSTHGSSLQIPPAQSLSKCQGTKEEKFLHLLAAGSTLKELTAGTAQPKPSSLLDARLLLWPTLEQPPQRAGGAVPGCFLLTFFGYICSYRRGTTPRDTLTIYCNTALCVKAQLNHTEAKPPKLLPPWAISPVGSAHAACCPVLGAAPAAPSPQVGAPSTCSVQNLH